MSTLDKNSPGNYGIYDVIKVLEFVQKYIREFGGDPDKVTLAGAGSGAGIVGILLVSPKSYMNGCKWWKNISHIKQYWFIYININLN